MTIVALTRRYIRLSSAGFAGCHMGTNFNVKSVQMTLDAQLTPKADIVGTCRSPFAASETGAHRAPQGLT